MSLLLALVLNPVLYPRSSQRQAAMCCRPASASGAPPDDSRSALPRRSSSVTWLRLVPKSGGRVCRSHATSNSTLNQ